MFRTLPGAVTQIRLGVLGEFQAQGLGLFFCCLTRGSWQLLWVSFPGPVLQMKRPRHELGCEPGSVCVHGLGSVHHSSLPSSDCHWPGGDSRGRRTGGRAHRQQALPCTEVPLGATHGDPCAVAEYFHGSCCGTYLQQSPMEGSFPAHLTDREIEAQ